MRVCAVCRARRESYAIPGNLNLDNLEWSRCPILDLTLLGLQSRFGDDWGQITWNLSALSPKRGWSSKGVKRAGSILEETMSIFFTHVFSTFFFHHVRNPDTTDNKQDMSSAGRVLQPAGYNATYACRPPAEQETTWRVW